MMHAAKQKRRRARPCLIAIASLAMIATAAPVLAQTKLPDGMSPLFDQPLSATAYTSRGRGSDLTARVELNASGSTIQTSIIRTQALGINVQITLTYWNSLFLISRGNKAGFKASSTIADSLAITDDQWRPVHIGSRIVAELDWRSEGTETVSCEITEKIEARQLNARLDGNAWKIDCLSAKPAEGPTAETRSVHYFIERAGFDFVGTVNDATYQLVDVEPRDD